MREGGGRFLGSDFKLELISWQRASSDPSLVT